MRGIATQPYTDSSQEVTTVLRCLVDAHESARQDRVRILESATDSAYRIFCYHLRRGDGWMHAASEAVESLDQCLTLVYASVDKNTDLPNGRKDAAALPLDGMRHHVGHYVEMLRDVDPSGRWPFSCLADLEISAWADRYAKEHSLEPVEEILNLRRLTLDMFHSDGMLPDYAQLFVEMRI